MRARSLLAFVSLLVSLWVVGAAAADESPRTVPTPTPAGPVAPPRAVLSADGCAACHATIVAEWRGSLHARSTRETNPLYRLATAKAVAALGEKAQARCQRCHYAEWTGATASQELPVEGVSCVVCHILDPKHPEKRLPDGRQSRIAGEDVVRYGTEKLCLACHGMLKSPEGHPVCTTGPESDEALVGNCVDCHMAEAKGTPTLDIDKPSHVSHAFPGSRSEALLKTAASLAVTFEGVAGAAGAAGASPEIVVTVTPGEIGHYLPTGTPLRSLELSVVALGADDDVLWRNHDGVDALAKAPEAVFQFIFSDKEGRRPVPAFLAHGKGVDQRIKPDAPREIRYPLPKGTQRVAATLIYRLAPAKLLAAPTIPDAWRKPVTIAEASATP